LSTFRHDKFSVFASVVTEKEAPGYTDVIKNPMDFGTMRLKVKQGKYGKGHKAASAFYHDFLLVFENCYLYNSDESEVTEEAARILGYLPEAFASACIHVAKFG
jgi:bromodomain-containing protein 7